MATLTFNIDDTKAALLKNVFGHPEWTNAQLAQQVKSFLIESLKLRVRAYQEQQAVDDAKDALVDVSVVS